MNNLTNYDEKDYPNTFGNEYETYTCFNCGDAIRDGDEFKLEIFWDNKFGIVCECCKDEIIFSQDNEPGDWTETSPCTFRHRDVKQPYEITNDLFKTLGDMFRPDAVNL